MQPVHVIVYSDFLCPWCFNVFAKLEALRNEFEEAWGRGSVDYEWRAYLLRPDERDDRSLEAFREYTKKWLQVADDEPRAAFQVWQSDEGPPLGSRPAHRVAKAAANLGDNAGRAMRERLFRAYFSENRDISRDATLGALWNEVGLDPAAFPTRHDAAIAAAIERDHNEAIQFGASGVPAMRLPNQELVITGAQPEAIYRRWFSRIRSGQI